MEPKNDATAIFTLAFHIGNLRMKNRHIGTTTLHSACLRHSLPERTLCLSASLVHSVHITKFTPRALLTLSILLHLLYKVDVIVLTVVSSSRPRAAFVLHGDAHRGLLVLQCPVPQCRLPRRATFLFDNNRRMVYPNTSLLLAS